MRALLAEGLLRACRQRMNLKPRSAGSSTRFKSHKLPRLRASQSNIRSSVWPMILHKAAKSVGVRLITVKWKVFPTKRKESNVSRYSQQVYFREMTRPTKAAKRTRFLPCIQPVARHNLRSFHIVVAVSQQSEYIQPRAAAAFEPRRSRRTGTRGYRRSFSTWPTATRRCLLGALYRDAERSC
jgi:hypothetical protein